MTIRENLEQWERNYLSIYASHSAESKGRQRFEKQCDIRPVFQRDRDRILHCNSFRRLKQKTQVFLSPIGNHYRTRLTHTLEVSQIARTISRAFRLNEDLTEAIALGHDLGHTPFGHSGEDILNEICPYGFKHYLQSVRVVDYIENDGAGLNLTYESYGKKSIVKKTKKGRKSDIKHAKRDKKSNSHESLSQKIFLTGRGTGSILLRRDIQAVSLQQ